MLEKERKLRPIGAGGKSETYLPTFFCSLHFFHIKTKLFFKQMKLKQTTYL